MDKAEYRLQAQAHSPLPRNTWQGKKGQRGTQTPSPPGSSLLGTSPIALQAIPPRSWDQSEHVTQA